jgi:hypothetical protein
MGRDDFGHIAVLLGGQQEMGRGLEQNLQTVAAELCVGGACGQPLDTSSPG